MAQTIVVPSGDRLEFPDGMADADIEKAIFAEYPDMAPKKGAMSRIGDAMKPAEREPMPSAADMINAPWTSSFVPQDETINLPGSVMDKFRQPAQKEQAMPIESGMGPMRKDFYDTTRSQIMAAPAQQHEALAVAEGQVGKVAAATLPERQARADRLAAGDMQPRSMQELSDQTEADLRQPRAMFDARQQANREWLQENSKAVAKSIQKNTGLSDEDADAEVERMARAGYKPDWLMDDMPTATLAQAISANVGATWPALQKSLLGLAEFAPNLPVPFVEYSRRTPKQLEMAVSSLDRQIRQARNVGGVIKSGSWNDVVASMGPSLALNLPPLVAGALASSVSPAAGMAIVNGGLGVMGLSAFGDAYLKGQQKGLQSGDNLMQASLSAAAEVIPEKLSLNALFAAFKTLGKGSAIETVKSFLKQQLTEHTTEQITTISHHLIDKAYTEPNKPIDQLWDEMKQTVMATAIQAPLLAGAGTGAYVAGRAGAKAIDNIAASRDLTYGREFDQDQIDAQVRQSLSPDAAQLRRTSPPPPPAAAPSARAELEAILNDKRPVEDILAENQNKAAEAAGWPAVNTPVVAKLIDGQLIRGQIQRIDNGAARFIASDGEVYVFEPGEAEISATSGDGTRAAPVKAVTADDVKLAEQAVDTNPTESQKAAGNYQLGHLNLQGMDIAIENPAGSVRSGVGKDGKPWANTLNHTYGYIKSAEAKDGDKLDAFIGPNPESQAVFVIDQIDPETGRYDEAKAMLGFSSLDEARAAYLSNYDAGWQGLGDITPMHIQAFKAWIAKGDTRKPLAYDEKAAIAARKAEAEQIALLEQINQRFPEPAAPAQTAQSIPSSPQPVPEAAGLQPTGDTNAQAQEAIAAKPRQQEAPAAAVTNPPSTVESPVAQPGGTTEERAYTKGQAQILAKRMTNQGLPSEAYPHPTQAGMWAIRVPGEQQAAPVETAQPTPETPAITKIKDAYGRTHHVKQSDLDNESRTQLPLYSSAGKRIDGTIHRDNIDLAGEKLRQRNAEDADNPMFDVITADNDRTFKTEAAAKRRLGAGYADTHVVAPASQVQPDATGFVLVRKPVTSAPTEKKEPWQYGELEYGDKYIDEVVLPDLRKQLANANGGKFQEYPSKAAAVRGLKERIDTLENHRDAKARKYYASLDNHYGAVRAALADGKPVPPVAYESYEDLKGDVSAGRIKGDGQEIARAELAEREEADKQDMGALFDEVLAEETGGSMGTIQGGKLFGGMEKSEAWWKGLTPNGRRRALDAVGAKAIKKEVLWGYLPAKVQKDLTAIIGTERDPIVEDAAQDEAASPITDQIEKQKRKLREAKNSGDATKEADAEKEIRKLRQQAMAEEAGQDDERFERAMRAAAGWQYEDGDVQTTALRYVPFDKALEIAREAVAAGVKPVPAQFHTRLDVTMDSALRLIAALDQKVGAGETAKAPKARWESYEITPSLREGRFTVREARGDGSYQNLAEFGFSNGRVVKLQHFFESPSTRTPIEMAIDRWRNQQNQTPLTAGQALSSAAVNTGKGLIDAIDGLGKLFGSNGSRLSMGISFDEDTYAKAKPLFSQAVAHFKDAGQDLKEAMRAVVRMVLDKFGPQVTENMRPYIVRFMEDVRDGKIDYAGNKEADSNGSERDTDTAQGERDQGSRGTDVQPGAGQADQASLGGRPSGNVGAADESGASGRPGAGAPSGDVGVGEAIPEGGNAANGRPRAGGTGMADAGTGGRRGGKQSLGGTDGGDQSGERASEASGAAVNYHIADPEQLIGGTPKVRFARNRKAIEALQAIQSEGRQPAQDELDAMAGYIGWGSFGQELFQGTYDRPRPKDGWVKESDWLREHLGKEAWESAQASIINAHYTDPITVSTMWDMARQLGFTGGRVLEPSMGVGNFFGLMPRDLMARSRLAGIEMDKTTGAMAKLLYPEANVQIKPYQDSKTADNFYDLVIGNWPFAKDGPADRRYLKLSPSLHDFFFLKALDQTRPGGLVIGITSAGTMDKQGTLTRAALAEKADLVAAFRLPTGAFEKYAGTSVVTDIIILKKRETPNADVRGSGWLTTAEVDTPSGNPIKVNEYFAANPGNVLGTLNFGHGTTYGRAAMVVDRPADLEARMGALAKTLPEGVFEPATTRAKTIQYVTNNTKDRQQSIVAQDGKLFQVQGEYLAPLHEVKDYRVKDGKKTADREAQLVKLIDMRRKHGALIDAERDGLEDVETRRKALSDAYKAFTKAHGLLGESDGMAIMKLVGDPFHPPLAALEIDGKPAAILSRATVRSRKKLENPTVRDALIMMRNESVFVDMRRVAQMSGVTEAAAANELMDAGAVFLTPEGTYDVSDVYLSGNVRRKLREAEAAAESGMNMERNIEALKQVIPADVPYFNIEAKLGATWVPPEYYKQFIEHMLGTKSDGIEVRFVVNRWKVKFADRSLLSRSEAQTTWGSPWIHFNKLVDHAMGNMAVKVWGKDAEGNKVLNEQASAEANEKANKIREEFGNWLWADPVRKIEMERAYNEVMNAIAIPTFDGSFMAFEGMALQRGNSTFDMRSHQGNAVYRGLVNRRGIYAHEVGTGKTYTMGALAVESRRYGIAKKPLIFAHNANSSSVAREINEQYPGAKILYIDNLAPDRIDMTMRQIANDEWDAIVVPHSLINRFALKEETLMEISRHQIEALEQEAIEAANEDGVALTVDMMNDEDAIKKVRSVTAKQLVHGRNQIIKKVQEMALKSSKEGAVAFEDMGIDMIIVDEAHEFKKPPLATRMSMKGLNKTASNQSISLMFLTDYVKKLNGGTGVHVFTGTPITNTINEIYNMMRFVMDDQMSRDGVREWDAWFNTFADQTSDVELTPAGEYEPVSRLASFVNVPELRRMAGQYMDIVFADDMPEFSPRETKSGKTLASENLTDAERAELLNGRTEAPIGRPYKKIINDVAEMSPEQLVIFDELKRRAASFKAATKKERKEIMLSGDNRNPVIVETAAANAGLDARLYDIEGNDSPESKVNRVVKNVIAHYNEHDKATQVIFVDKGYTSESVSRKKDRQTGQVRVEKKPRFNLVRDIVAKLTEHGIPPNQIAIVDGSVSKDKRKEIADAMNESRIRVVIGQTDTLGVGVNMQVNLRAMHHMDAPWMPGELEQRNGRGHRQGNKWNTVLEYRYITERIDGRRWQVLSIKERFIKSFLKADDSVRVIEGDAVSLDEDGDLGNTLSDAAGDPRLLLMNKLRSDVQKLENRERMHAQGIFDAKREIGNLKDRIERVGKALANYRKDSEKFRAVAKDELVIEVGGRKFSDAEKANEAMELAASKVKVNADPIEIANIWGFTITAAQPVSWRGIEYHITGAAMHQMGKPTVESARATMYGVAKRAEGMEADIAEWTDSIPRMEEATKAPFARAKDLDKKRKMLADIEIDIQNNPVPAPAWLRNGTPAGTEVFVDGKPLTVEGHRYTNDGYYVTVSDGDGTRDIDYMEAKDENGLPKYEEHEFEAPKIIKSDKVHNSIEPLSDLSADRNAAITRAIDRAIAMEQGKDVAPLKRQRVRNRLGKLRSDLEAGKITEPAFVAEVENLHAQMEIAYQSRQLEPHKGRERGADWIRQKLLEAKRRGDISEEAAKFAEWFVLKNPALVEDLGISLRSKQEGQASGNYNPATRVMTLFKSRASDTTAVHEILHHLERMMPAEMQEAIRKEWIKQVTKELAKAQKAKDQKRIDYFTAVLAGDQKKATEILTGGALDGFNAPISDASRAKRMFHSTSTEAAALKILEDGEIRPPDNKHAMAKLAPVVGRAYVSPSLETASIYSLGGVMMGHDYNWSARTDRAAGRYGYIFEIDPSSYGDVQPDEDSVGELAANAMKDANRNSELRWLADLAQNLGTPNQIRGAKFGEYAAWAQLGKKLVKHMSDAQKTLLIDKHGAHIANLGPLKIARAWKVDKSKAKEIARDGSNVLDVAEQVYGDKFNAVSDRAGYIAKAKTLGLPATGTTESIANLVRIAESDPRTWTESDLKAIAPYLSIHQDVRAGSAGRVASIMQNGLRSGMVDALDGMVSGRNWTWAGGLKGGDAYVFLSGTLKYRGKGNPALAEGNMPLFHIKTEAGQSVLDSLQTATAGDGLHLDLDIGRDYRYLNPSEFWAVSMTETVADRFKAKDSIWSRSLQWLKEALEHIKSALGLNSTHPMIKALDAISNGDGEFVSKDMLSDAKLYASIEPISPVIEEVVGPVLRDASLPARLLLHPRQMAANHKEFAPVFDTAIRQYEERDSIVSKLGDFAKPYFDLSHAKKRRVGQIIEQGRLDRMTYTEADLENGIHHHGGDLVRLDAEEKAAYIALRKSFTHALTLFRNTMLEEYGFPELVNEERAAIRLAQMIAAGEIEESRLEWAKKVAVAIHEIEQANRTGYVPFTRYGQFVVAVKALPNGVDVVEDDDLVLVRGVPESADDGTADAKLVNIVADLMGQFDPERNAWIVPVSRNQAVRALENTLYATKVEVGSIKEWRSRGKDVTEIPEVKAVYEAAKARYGNVQNSRIIAFHVAEKEKARDANITAMDELAKIASVDTETWDEVRAKLQDAIKSRGFRRHFFGSDNTPGYSTDFERSIADYIIGMSGYLARRKHVKEFDDAIKRIKAPKLAAYADEYRQYINSPADEFALVKQIGFLSYIAGTVATAFTNLTQVPMLTVPTLTQFVPNHIAVRETARAWKDAQAMFSPTKTGLQMFDPAKVPEDVREAFMAAWNDQLFVPLETLDLMATASVKTVGGRTTMRVLNQTTQAIAYLFMFAERLNRITTFVAAARISRMPVARQNAARVTAGDAWAKFSIGGRKWNERAFAEWAIDESQYRMGKVNRPKISRGVGSPLLQFKGYMMQTLEAGYRMAAMHGRRGQWSFLAALAMMLMLGGLWGLPGLEDLRDIIEKFYKLTTGKDLDMKTEVRRIVAETTGSATVGSAAAKGIPYATVGVDMSRVGMGNIIPDSPLQMLGIPADLAVGRPQRAAEKALAGNYYGAASELLPNFLKNPAVGFQWKFDGVRDRYGSRLMTPGEFDYADVAVKSLGWTPTKVTNRRDYAYAESRAESGINELKRRYTNDLVRAYVREQAAATDAERRQYQGEQKAVLDAIAKHNAKAGQEQIIKLDPDTLRKKVAAETLGGKAREGKERKLSRDAAQQRRELFQLP